jgi:TRAP-type C4-dicarboxylate transport system permease large subunit
MVASGYDRRMSAGVIMAGASLAPIIPPSVAVILIATLAGASIAKLLIAGILPGLLLACLFILYTTVRSVMDPTLTPEAAREVILRATARQRIIALVRVSPLIMVSSNMFGQLLALTGAASQLTQAVASINVPISVLVLMLMAITFVFCVFADEIAMLLILIPLYKPIVVAMGINDVWFWTLMLINLVLGGLTPPFGYLMYAFKSGAPDMPLTEVYAATWPFVGIYLVAIGLIIVFPQIATYLPSLL